MLKFVFSILLISGIAHAQFADTKNFETKVLNNQFSFRNFVQNPSCKRNVVGITGTAVVNTTNPLDGISDCTWDPASSGQLLTFAMDTNVQGLQGLNCEARVNYSGSAALVKAYVLQGGRKVTADNQLTNTGTMSSVQSINYPCDGSATTTVTLEATGDASNAQYAVYAGPATNIGSVAQASLWAEAAYNGSFQATVASSAVFIDMGAFNQGAPTVTTAYNVLAATTASFAITVSPLPPGEYLALYTGPMKITGNFSNSKQCYWRFSDGTNFTIPAMMEQVGTNEGQGYSGLQGRFIYTTTQQARTFTIQAAQQTSSSTVDTCSIGAQINSAQAGGEFLLYRFPTASQTSLNLNSTGWYVDATEDGANPDLGTAAVTSYTAINDANLTVRPQTGSQPVGVMCSSSNPATAPSNSPTTCAAGSESVGINFAIPEAGTYEVCWYGTHDMVVSSGKTVDSAFQLVETPTNASTITLEGGTRFESGSTGMTIATGTADEKMHAMSNCSFFQWTTAGIHGVRLMYEQAVNGPTSSSILADAGANDGQRNMRWTIKPITRQLPTPILIGSVSSSNAGAIRVAAVQATNTGTGTQVIVQQTGNDFASINRPTVGSVNFNLNTGAFTATPICTISKNGGSGFIWISSASAGGIATSSRDQGGAVSDDSFFMTCTGPR